MQNMKQLYERYPKIQEFFMGTKFCFCIIGFWAIVSWNEKLVRAYKD